MNTSAASTGLRGFVATAVFGALAASVSAVSAAAPSAADRSVSVRVKFADLDPSKPRGARVLYGRIRAAAVGACSYYWFETDAAEARCVHDAIANAVTQVNQPQLWVVFNANYKTPVPIPLLSESP